MIKKIISIVFLWCFLLPVISIAMEQQKTGISLGDIASTLNDNKGNIWQATKFGVPAVLAYRYLDKQEKDGKTTIQNGLGKVGLAASAGAIGWAGLTLAEQGAKALWDYAKWKLAALAGLGVVHKAAKWAIGHSTREKVEHAIRLDNEMLFNWKRNEDQYNSAHKLSSILRNKNTKEELRQYFIYVLNNNYIANLQRFSGNRSINLSSQNGDAFIGEAINQERKLLQGYIEQLQNITLGIPWARYKTDVILGKDSELGLQSLQKRDELQRTVTLRDIALDEITHKWPVVKLQKVRKDEHDNPVLRRLRYTGKHAGFRKKLFEHPWMAPYTDKFFALKNTIKYVKDVIAIDSSIAWQNDRTCREWLKQEADWAEPYWFSNYLVLPWVIKTIFCPARTEIFDLIITLKELQERLTILQDVLRDKVDISASSKPKKAGRSTTHKTPILIEKGKETDSEEEREEKSD